MPTPIDSLVSQLDSLMAEGRAIAMSDVSRNRVASGPWAGWRTRSIAFLERNLGSGDAFTRHFTAQTGSTYESARDQGVAILGGLRADLIDGNLSTFRELVAAELLSDLLEQADELMRNAAAHGDHSAYTASEVRATLDGVRTFLSDFVA